MTEGRKTLSPTEGAILQAVLLLGGIASKLKLSASLTRVLLEAEDAKDFPQDAKEEYRKDIEDALESTDHEIEEFMRVVDGIIGGEPYSPVNKGSDID